MAAFINDIVFDNGLSQIPTNVVRLDITADGAGLPTTYAAVTGNTLGNETSLTISAVGDASSGTGRSVTVAEIPTGSLTGSGTAGYWAITDGSSTVYSSGSLSTAIAVVSGNQFSLGEIEIFIRDAVSI